MFILEDGKIKPLASHIPRINCGCFLVILGVMAMAVAAMELFLKAHQAIQLGFSLGQPHLKIMGEYCSVVPVELMQLACPFIS